MADYYTRTLQASPDALAYLAKRGLTYSAMTGQSLFYLGEADLKHKTLAIAEEEGARHAAYALKLLQSQGTLTIRHGTRIAVFVSRDLDFSAVD